MKLNNPFLVRGYYGPEYFCDRQKETEQLVDSVLNEGDVTLIAPRRYGKTRRNWGTWCTIASSASG